MEKKLKVKYTLPFSSLSSLSEKELNKRLSKGDTLEFSHTLSLIFTSLLDKGFIIDGFMSDTSDTEPTDSFVRDAYFAIKAIKTR